MWKIFASLCIRRPVVLTPELTPCQSRIQDLFVELETQNSHMSAHEMRHKADLERMAEMAKHQQEGKSTEKMDDAVSLLTAKDLELAWEASEKEFWKLSEKSSHSKPASSTKATAWRELNRNLVLLVQQKLGTSSDWGLPAVEVTGTQTLRSAAEALARSTLPPEAKVIIVGNAPVGMHKYFYRTGDGKKQGVQMYFMNAYVDKLWPGENVITTTGDRDGFVWSTRDELPAYLDYDKNYLKRIRAFFVDY